MVAANELVSLPIKEEGLWAFAETIIPMPITAPGLVITERVAENVKKARKSLMDIFDSKTIPIGIRNTAYGLLEAGIEYFDHIRPYRSKETYFTRNLMTVSAQKTELNKVVREVAAQYATAV